MGFFDALRRVLGSESSGGHRADSDDRLRLAEAWGLDTDSPSPEFPGGQGTAADPAEMAAPPKTSHYDRDQWRKKLKRILEKLPATQGEWPDLIAEAGALNLGKDWVEHCQKEEFALLVRRAVADRNLTLDEHHKLDVARMLIGISESEAEATLHAIEAEAQEFFGQPIKES